MRATDYYVSPSGNDANDGLSPATAWATLDEVYNRLLGLDALQPGDRILLEGGATHFANSALYFDAADGGTRANPVVISSYGTGKATIDAGISYGFFLENSAGYVIENLVITSLVAGKSSSVGVFVLTNTPAAIRYDGLTLRDLEISDFQGGGVTIGTYGGSGVRAGYSNVLIEGCEIFENLEHGIEVYGNLNPTAYNHADIIVRNCEIYDNPGNPATGGVNTGHGLQIAQTDGARVEEVVAYRNGSNIAATDKGPMGIWLWDVKDGTIQNCESYGNRTDVAPDGTLMGGGGIGIDGGSKNCTIQYCYTHDNEGPGILVDNFDPSKSADGVTVRFNISQNDVRNGGYGSIFLHKNPAADLLNVDIYHNTIYTSPSANGSAPGSCLRVGAEGIFARVLGNIFYTTGAGQFAISEVGAPNPLTIQYNLYFASGASNLFAQNGTDYTGLTAWQTATGYELDGGSSVALTTDPLLTAPGTAGIIGDPTLLVNLTEYQLTSSSVLNIDGVNLTAEFGIDVGGQDFYGVVIPSSGEVGMGSALEVPVVFAIGEGLFTLEEQGSAARLTYTLDPEDRIDHIEVQVRSDYAPEFRSLGNMSEENEEQYLLLDFPTRGERYYYRLKVVQVDGRTTLTDVQSILLPEFANLRVAKLANHRYRLWLPADMPNTVPFELMDLKGQVVHTGLLNRSGGEEWSLQTPASLSLGRYWLRVITPQGKQSIALPQ